MVPKSIVVSTLCLVFLSGIVGAGQHLKQGSLPAAAGEISLAVAAQKARTTLLAIGRPDPGVEHYYGSLSIKGIAGKRFRLWQIRKSPEFYILIDPKSSSVVAFSDLKKHDDRYRKQNRTNGVFFSNEQEARVKLKS